MTKYAEQITAYEAKRGALVGSMDAIMSKAASEGATLDAAQQEEYDGFAADIKAVDDHLGRLRTMEATTATKATPVNGANTIDAATTRGGQIVVKAQPKMAPGIEFARAVKCYGMAKGIMGEALRIAESAYGENANVVGTLKSAMKNGGNLGVQKAAVPAGSTLSGSWAEDLVGDETGAYADFVEFLRPTTILGKFGTNGIPSLRNVPFRVALVSQTAGGEGYWVGEGKAKPLTSFDFSRTTLEPLKVANIAVLTDEVIRSSSPSAEAIVRDELAKALRQRLDIDFINPNKAASAGVSPASVTNGAATVAAPGTGDADDVRLGVRALMQKFIDADNPPTSGVWIMSTSSALALSMMVNALGQSEFNGLGMNGGTFFGLPVITSEHVGSIVALVNASDIYLGDDGGIQIDLSREASLEMLDGSLLGNSASSPPATGAAMVSMFQTNSVAFRAERIINWARRRTTSVAYLSAVNWGGTVPVS